MIFPRAGAMGENDCNLSHALILRTN